MSNSEEFEQIRIIADAVCDEEATPEQMSELEQLLEKSAEARKFYLDYVGMHARLKAENTPAFEVVMRRLQVDELIVRPAGSGGQPPAITSIEAPVIGGLPESKKQGKGICFYLIVLFLVITVSLISYFWGRENSSIVASLKSGTLRSLDNEILKEQKVKPGVFTAEENSELEFLDGDILKFESGSVFEIKNQREVYLQSGSLKRDLVKDSKSKVITDHFDVESSESGYEISLDKNEISITTKGDGVVLMPKRWKPRHFWNFDEKGDRALDIIGTAHGVPGKTTTKVPGIIGKGAYKFDNKKSSFLDMGSGGGVALGTGSFSVTDGISIEALIKTNWSGKYNDYDEIFRKDQAKDLRMVLGFQNDNNFRKYSMPIVDSGPTLSFGLYLVGQEYHELEILLDGKEGRPSLDELRKAKLNHVVATYNTESGLKALYINGIKVASHKYPPGTKMLSGGPGDATIGNTPSSYAEPFTGIIDEVAFYDYALSPYVIKHHYNLVNNGTDYFESQKDKFPEQIKITLPASTKVNINSLTGLPE